MGTSSGSNVALSFREGIQTGCLRTRTQSKRADIGSFCPIAKSKGIIPLRHGLGTEGQSVITGCFRLIADGHCAASDRIAVRFRCRSCSDQGTGGRSVQQIHASAAGHISAVHGHVGPLRYDLQRNRSGLIQHHGNCASLTNHDHERLFRSFQAEDLGISPADIYPKTVVGKRYRGNGILRAVPGNFVGYALVKGRKQNRAIFWDILFLLHHRDARFHNIGIALRQPLFIDGDIAAAKNRECYGFRPIQGHHSRVYPAFGHTFGHFDHDKRIFARRFAASNDSGITQPRKNQTIHVHAFRYAGIQRSVPVDLISITGNQPQRLRNGIAIIRHSPIGNGKNLLHGVIGIAIRQQGALDGSVFQHRSLQLLRRCLAVQGGDHLLKLIRQGGGLVQINVVYAPLGHQVILLSPDFAPERRVFLCHHTPPYSTVKSYSCPAGSPFREALAAP